MKRIKRFMKGAQAMFMAGAHSPNFVRFLGVLNIANALREAWMPHHSFWWPLTASIFAAAVGIYALWVSSLIRRDIVISLPMPSHGQQVDLLTRLRNQVEPETDPKKVM